MRLARKATPHKGSGREGYQSSEGTPASQFNTDDDAVAPEVSNGGELETVRDAQPAQASRSTQSAQTGKTGETAEDHVLESGTAAFDAGVGEMPSWDELVAEHADSVYRLALRLTGNTHDAEDLTQETFMRVFRSLKSYKPGTFEGWLHRITTNLFLDMVRHRQAIRMEALPENYDAVPGNETDPEEAMLNANVDPALQQALDALPPDYRVAVVLCDVVGMSYDDIADTLGIKMGTVRSRVHRGRAQLRASLNTSEGTLRYVGA